MGFSLKDFLGSTAGAGLLSFGGDLASTALAGHFNAKEASKNRNFQMDMSNTAYQRAAVDLEKAGLNRILALGSPAQAPSGSAASISSPSLGTSFQAGSSAKAQRNVQAAQATLLGEEATTQRTQQGLLATQAGAIQQKLESEIALNKANAASALTASKRGSGVAEISSAIAELVKSITHPGKGEPGGLLPTIANKLPKVILGEGGVNSAKKLGRKVYDFLHGDEATRKLRNENVWKRKNKIPLQSGASGEW